MTDRRLQFNRQVRQEDRRWFDAQQILLFGRGAAGATQLFRQMRAAYLHVGPERAKQLAEELDRDNGRDPAPVGAATRSDPGPTAGRAKPTGA